MFADDTGPLWPCCVRKIAYTLGPPLADRFLVRLRWSPRWHGASNCDLASNAAKVGSSLHDDLDALEP